MTWAVRFVQDTQAPGVGTVTAIDGAVVVSRRLDTNDAADISLFLAECQDALAKANKLAGDSAAVIAKVEAVLNGAG